jgi:hypothetical protein
MFEAVKSIEDRDSVRIEEDEVREESLSYVKQFADERWTWRR